ncbi:MAG: endonuclease, partial [Halorientalis sp.]
MSLPPYLYVDRRLPDAERVRETLEAETLTPFEDEERLERLHRVFYPAFRVTFSYETDKGEWFGTKEKEVTTFLDGLWAGNDAKVAKYADTESLVNVSTGDYDLGVEHSGLDESVLLQFQVANDKTESLLPDRVADWAKQRDFGHHEDADVFLRKLRDTYGLPGDFDPQGFEEVLEVTRVYLPFWLAEFQSETADHSIMFTFREEVTDDEVQAHGWLSGFIAEDPARIADYGYQVDLDRIEKQLSDDDTDDQSRDVDDDQSTDRSEPVDRGPPGINRQSPTGGSRDDVEVVQPDGVDMDADTLVETHVDRGFGDVGGMADLKDTLKHKVVRPLEEPEVFEEYGIGVVNGVLLHGPPGCGKTYIA